MSKIHHLLCTLKVSVPFNHRTPPSLAGPSQADWHSANFSLTSSVGLCLSDFIDFLESAFYCKVPVFMYVIKCLFFGPFLMLPTTGTFQVHLLDYLLVVDFFVVTLVLIASQEMSDFFFTMSDFRNVCDNPFRDLGSSWPKHQEDPKPLTTIQAHHRMMRPGSNLDIFHLIQPVAAEVCSQWCFPQNWLCVNQEANLKPNNLQNKCLLT